MSALFLPSILTEFGIFQSAVEIVCSRIVQVFEQQFNSDCQNQSMSMSELRTFSQFLGHVGWPKGLTAVICNLDQ